MTELNVVVRKGSNEPNTFIMDSLINTSNLTVEMKVYSAKSHLSVEIVKTLQKLLLGTNMSPFYYCNMMIANLPPLNEISSAELLRSLVFNELHKVAMEASMHTGVEKSDLLNSFYSGILPICGNVIKMVRGK